MEQMEQIKLLQAIYAGALADAVLRFGREGVLERVTQAKHAEQMASGKARAAQLGIASYDEVFGKLSALMGCADWSVSRDEQGGANRDRFALHALRVCQKAWRAEPVQYLLP